MTKRLILILLLSAAALAVAGGDEIKWAKSKPIIYYGPQTDPSQLGSDLADIGNHYKLIWAPQFHADVEHIRVVWNSWELAATALNNFRKSKKISEQDYNAEIDKSRSRLTSFLVFNVSVVPTTRDFYEASANGYWHFSLCTEKGELELANIDDRADTTIINPLGSGDYRAALLTNTYHVYFANPYKEDKPEYLRLIIEGGDVKRGFEWRFK